MFFFAIGSNRNWSYLLPRALPPGRYVLDVKAFDGRRNRDEKFVTRQEQSRVRGGAPKSRGTTAGARARRRARAGDGGGEERDGGGGGDLAGAPDGGSGVGARVQGERLHSAGRAAGRARRSERVGWHVRDFGQLRAAQRRAARASCSWTASRGDRNRGQDGWVYKVNDFARNVGAADVAGPRLRDGDRVLWLYCVLDAATRSCQRSLRVCRHSHCGPPGGTLRVLVRGYDNERRATPVAGRDGHARAGDCGHRRNRARDRSCGPRPARTTLAASAPGAIPRFP